MMFHLEDIHDALNRINGTIHKTPVLTSSYIDSLCNMNVYFKCEHLQKTGSFKARGALNAVKIILNDPEKKVSSVGTIAIEFLEQIPDLDALLIPVGGGGLCSGMVVAAKKIKPDLKVYCVEPEGKNLQHSFDTNTRFWNPNEGPVKTIADGIRVLQVGEKCFPLISEKCEKKILTVNDEEIIQALKLVYSRMKQVIEPTGAVSLAALLKYKNELATTNLKKIGAIFCGGNIDLKTLSSFF